MNKLYGKLVDGKLVRAIPVREELPDGRGYVYKYISDEDLESGEYKEIVTRGYAPANLDALVRAGRVKVDYTDIGNYILQTVMPVSNN